LGNGMEVTGKAAKRANGLRVTIRGDTDKDFCCPHIDASGMRIERREGFPLRSF